MDKGYFLKVKSPFTGGYMSSEQIDLLSIVMCKTEADLVAFVSKSDQLNHKYSRSKLRELFTMGLESTKRIIFEDYQNTLVDHDSSKVEVLLNKLINCGVAEDDAYHIANNLYGKENAVENIKTYLINQYGYQAEYLFKRLHRFISRERDQNKDPNLYDEFVVLANNLDKFNSITIGSGKLMDVYNPLFDMNDIRGIDFYHTFKDIDFAVKNNKNIRYHSLLVKGCDNLFEGKSKDEIIEMLTDHVKVSINLINLINSKNTIIVNGEEVPLINKVDLFNEIVSFDKDKDGHYYNIWEKYGITIKDLKKIFQYALDKKDPKVSYVYNEPMLEIKERREKVLSVLEEIDKEMPGLIDTVGTQMHISYHTSDEDIKDAFDDFKKLQDSGKKIEITEFDMSLVSQDLERVYGPYATSTIEDVYDYKQKRIDSISDIINNSGVNLTGVTYWSLTDRIDFNIERLKEETKLSFIPTACGGLFPTYDTRQIDIYNLGETSKQK